MRRFLLFVVAAGIFGGGSASACPCGCGTIAVGVLEPGQKTKFVTSISSENRVTTITPQGDERDDYIYDRAVRSDLTLTQSLAPHLVLSASAGAYQNRKDDLTSGMRLADPSVGVGYTLLQQNFMRKWQPRVDVYLAYKHPLAKSFREAELDPDQKSYLAVGGNGLKEVALGGQAWFGMSEWKMGTSLRYVAFPDVLRGAEAGPEAAGQAGVQFAKVFTGKGGLTLETGMEWLGETTRDGEGVDGSSRRTDHVSLSGSYVLRMFHSLGLSYKRKNVFGLTRNAVGGDSITVSYQAVLI